jgi:C4-dicarboxylate-specific signal transduction histidine kinase
MPERGDPSSTCARPAATLAIVAASAALILALAAGAALWDGWAAREAARAELRSVAELQAARLDQWRRAREADVRVLLETPALARTMRGLARGDRTAEADSLRELSARMARHFGFMEVRFVGVEGETLLSALDAIALPGVQGHVSRALASGGFVWSHIHAHDERPHVELAAGVYAPDGERLGALVLVMNPAVSLFPKIESWPRPTRTGESLIVERDGDAAAVLSPRAGAGAATRVSVERVDHVAVKAALGASGVVSGRSADGTAITAAIRSFPGTPWVLMAQMDDDELYAPATSRSRTALLLAIGAAVLAVAAGAAVWWRRAIRHIEEEQRRGALDRDALARRSADESTARKAAEEAAALSERKFQSALEAARFGVLVADASGHVIEHNRALGELLGAPGSLVGRSITDFDGSSDETRWERADGTHVDLRVRAAAVRDGAGALKFTVAILEDVTEQRRLHEQLAMSERLASLGTLSAGVAHEINNPLSFVVSNVRYAADELESCAAVPAEVRAALADAAEGCRRVQDIVRDLKTFARGSDGSGATDDFGALIRSSVSLAQSEIKHRARLTLEVPSLPPVNGSPHRLGQLLLNLLVNAAQALPEGRTDENEISVRAGVAGDRVWVEVADTGPGVPRALAKRIFDPFFTTKPPGLGTGLGLSICHGIATAARGSIALVPSERGAVFRVELPVAAAAPRAAETVPPRDLKARVLVVDDEPHVGRSLQRILSPQHHVVYVDSAAKALAELERDPGYDVVLCDVMLPGMSGIDFFDELSRRAPRLAPRVAFMSGGAFTPRAREFFEGSNSPKIEKPFDAATLRAVVNRIAAQVTAAGR